MRSLGCEASEFADPVTAAERLQILLRQPLSKRVADDRGGYTFKPFWWFRGRSNLDIDRFQILALGRCLLGPKELSLRRIAAFRSEQEEREFVYVECAGDPPVGVYTYSDGQIDTRLRQSYEAGHGAYVEEEYGWWSGRAITRAEYDDDAAVVDGRATRTRGAQLRVRFLTPYNFLVAGKASVVNQHDVDRPLATILDRFLMEGQPLDGLVACIGALPQNREVQERVS